MPSITPFCSRHHARTKLLYVQAASQVALSESAVSEAQLVSPLRGGEEGMQQVVYVNVTGAAVIRVRARRQAWPCPTRA